MPGDKHNQHDSKNLCLREINSPWRAVLHMGRKHVFGKGHRELCDCDSFYLLISGKVRLDYLGDSGVSSSTLHIGPGSLFNEIPALLGITAWQVGFTCMENTEAWIFPAELLQDEDFIVAYPRLYANLTHSVAEKASRFFQHVMSSRNASITSRLCSILLRLYQHPDQKMSQCELATLLGLHPTTVARHLRGLREKGIIGAFTKYRLEVFDAEALQKLAHF